jgi:hypothetical protein
MPRHICEKPDPLKVPGGVASYRRNSQFYRINDILAIQSMKRIKLCSPFVFSGGVDSSFKWADRRAGRLPQHHQKAGL